MKRGKWYCVYKPHPAVNVRGFINPILRLGVKKLMALQIQTQSFPFSWRRDINSREFEGSLSLKPHKNSCHKYETGRKESAG